MSSFTKRVIVIIPARNENKFLANTLEALREQILKPYKIIVINDGSTDNTADIARRYGVIVLDLVNRGFRATGHPILANVINKGLEQILNDECHYIMILGADHIIPSNYISTIVSTMEVNKSLVIASGTLKGEPQRDRSPRGSGRIIKYTFWKKFGLQYPSWYGFESYLVYKALIESYEVKVLRNMIGWSQRPTGKTTNYISYGKAMRALGYHPLYAIGRIILTCKCNPIRSIQMLFGYLNLSVKKYDIAQDVKKLQFTEIKKRISSKLKY